LKAALIIDSSSDGIITLVQEGLVEKVEKVERYGLSCRTPGHRVLAVLHQGIADILHWLLNSNNKAEIAFNTYEFIKS